MVGHRQVRTGRPKAQAGMANGHGMARARRQAPWPGQAGAFGGLPVYGMAMPWPWP